MRLLEHEQRLQGAMLKRGGIAGTASTSKMSRMSSGETVSVARPHMTVTYVAAPVPEVVRCHDASRYFGFFVARGRAKPAPRRKRDRPGPGARMRRRASRAGEQALGTTSPYAQATGIYADGLT